MGIYSNTCNDTRTEVIRASYANKITKGTYEPTRTRTSSKIIKNARRTFAEYQKNSSKKLRKGTLIAISSLAGKTRN